MVVIFVVLFLDLVISLGHFLAAGDKSMLRKAYVNRVSCFWSGKNKHKNSSSGENSRVRSIGNGYWSSSGLSIGCWSFSGGRG